jgi:hypothetical protein
MPKETVKVIASIPAAIDENYLFSQISAIIEKRKNRVAARVSNKKAMMFWEIGPFVNTSILDNNRTEYGKIRAYLGNPRLKIRRPPHA